MQLVGAGKIHDATWATYEELRAIDPKERALDADERIHGFAPPAATSPRHE